MDDATNEDGGNGVKEFRAQSARAAYHRGGTSTRQVDNKSVELIKRAGGPRGYRTLRVRSRPQRPATTAAEKAILQKSRQPTPRYYPTPAPRLSIDYIRLPIPPTYETKGCLGNDPRWSAEVYSAHRPAVRAWPPPGQLDCFGRDVAAAAAFSLSQHAEVAFARELQLSEAKKAAHTATGPPGPLVLAPAHVPGTPRSGGATADAASETMVGLRSNVAYNVKLSSQEEDDRLEGERLQRRRSQQRLEAQQAESQPISPRKKDQTHLNHLQQELKSYDRKHGIGMRRARAFADDAGSPLAGANQRPAPNAIPSSERVGYNYTPHKLRSPRFKVVNNNKT